MRFIGGFKMEVRVGVEDSRFLNLLATPHVYIKLKCMHSDR